MWEERHGRTDQKEEESRTAGNIDRKPVSERRIGSGG